MPNPDLQRPKSRSGTRPVVRQLPGVILIAVLCFLVFDAARSFLFAGREGDFIHFYDAATAVLRGENPYTFQGLETQLNWYAYLPMFALVLAPLALLPFKYAAAAWAVCNGLLLAGALFLGGREVHRRLRLDVPVGRFHLALLLASVLLIDKFRGELRLGQSDAFIAIWMVLGLIWLDRRPILSGIALGIATNVKLQGLIFLPYLVARGRWKQAGSLVVSSVGIALGGSLIWGWQRNLQYLSTCLGWIGGLVGVAPPRTDSDIFPLDWERSVAIPSVAARAVRWLDFSDTLALPMVALVAFAMFLGGWLTYRLAGVPLFRGRFGSAAFNNQQDQLLTLFEWSGLMVAALAFSPQTTVRHFILILFVCVVAAVLVVNRRTGVRTWPLALSMGIFVAGMVLPPGGERFDSAVVAWRSIGGAMWCLVSLYFVTLWTGLRWAAAGSTNESLRESDHVR